MIRVAVAVLVLAGWSIPIAAQPRNVTQQIRTYQERRDSIRQARGNLEFELQRLRSRARDISSELDNIGRQRDATGRLVNELDRQLSGLSTQLDTISLELILVEDALAEKQAVLERRATEIYKRGSLWMFEVLLAAESFGDLLSRYKYLNLVSRQDRALVTDIAELRDRLADSRDDLVTVQTEVSDQRQERNRELSRYANLERQRQRTLNQTQRSQQQAAALLDELARDETQLNELIVSLERARTTTGGSLTAASITENDLASLDWPLDGPLVYEFGQQPFRDGTSIPRVGIGIQADPGSPVRAVRSGVVWFTQALGTYGLIVMLDHGGGYSTLYTNLSDINVVKDQIVAQGDIIGLSGGEGSDEGPHLGFQIRQTPPGGGGGPVPLNPMNWLKRR